MIEIDEGIVDVAREYLGDWSYCGDVKGSEEWCEDDERAELVFTDAIAWFKNQFLNYTDTNTIGKFDVVIMDAL